MLTQSATLDWLRRCHASITAHQDRLTALDTAIGDADHGINMRRGFDKVVEKLPTVADKDIGAILKTTGMTLLSSVGGASGPLYGTFFMRAATVAGTRMELSPAELLAALEAGVAGVVERGRAEPGDKTMCDVWRPMLEALKSAIDAGQTPTAALDAMLARGREAQAATAPMIARKGRASYLGERSVGHEDPGGASTLLIVEALRDAVAS